MEWFPDFIIGSVCLFVCLFVCLRACLFVFCLAALCLWLVLWPCSVPCEVWLLPLGFRGEMLNDCVQERDREKEYQKGSERGKPSAEIK